MSLPTQRQRRYAELLRRLIAPTLHNDAVTGVRSGYLAVHEVTVTPDLRHAKVYVYPLDPSLINNSSPSKNHIGTTSEIPEIKELNARAVRIQSYVNKNLRSKNSPKISFHLDTTFQQASRIEHILKNNRSRDSDKL